jgi:hypothetical protein
MERVRYPDGRKINVSTRKTKKKHLRVNITRHGINGAIKTRVVINILNIGQSAPSSHRTGNARVNGQTNFISTISDLLNSKPDS